MRTSVIIRIGFADVKLPHGQETVTIPTSMGHPTRLLRVDPTCPVIPHLAGLFLSRGQGIHPDRRIGDHELILVRRGVLAIAEDGRTLDTAAGETLLLWPGSRHRGTVPYSRDLEFYWLHFEARRPRSAHVLEVPQRAKPVRPDRLRELIHRFLSDQDSGKLTPTAGSLLVMLMFSEICEQQGEAGVEAALAARAETIIATRFHQSISTSSIAAELKCNADYLGRIYRRSFGRTIVAAINRRRMYQARALLLENRKNIAAIARECGFSGPGYFRRMFKRHLGSTPGDFRAGHARMPIVS